MARTPFAVTGRDHVGTRAHGDVRRIEAKRLDLLQQESDVDVRSRGKHDIDGLVDAGGRQLGGAC